MLVINFETIKEKINDFYISNYYVAKNLNDMLQNNNWFEVWETREVKYQNKVYADFDVLDYVFQYDSEKLQYLTWNNSNFGKIKHFLEFFSDFYVCSNIDRNIMLEEINKSKQNNETLFLFEYSKITSKQNKQNMI